MKITRISELLALEMATYNQIRQPSSLNKKRVVRAYNRAVRSGCTERDIIEASQTGLRNGMK
jgi:hypothetical protein